LPRKVFHELVGLDQAVRLVASRVKLSPKGLEYVELEKALYRILAEDLYAPVDYPPFDRSEVDGYAVKSTATFEATEMRPVKLAVRGDSVPGVDPASLGLSCREDVAVRISTGAPVPEGCDAVVMEEYTEEEGGSVAIYRPVSPGENVSTAASDVSAGDFVLPKGTLLKHQHIALLAGLGFSKIPVYVKPRVAVYSTGIEVVKPGEPLRLGKIYDVNGYLASSFLRELGADVEYRGVLPDDFSTIKKEVEESIEHYDVVITSGGTSAGVSDLVYRVFEAVGEVLVHGLKTRPGKPTVIATAGGKLLIGLPGFPLSAYMILVRVVKPLISALTGLKYYEKPMYVRLPLRVRKQVGRALLIPSILVKSGEEYAAYPVSMSSGSIYAIAYSDGFVELPEDAEVVEEGAKVPFYFFADVRHYERLTIIGSNDPLLEDLLKKTGLVYASRILNVGSTGGWLAVQRGDADIAPTHLLDPATGKYNTPFLDKYGLRGKAVLIRGFDRLIGFVVARGNPKNITSFRDFFRSDVRIVNRSRGSGIRTFIDLNLEKIAPELGIKVEEIPRLVKGYTYEVKTHTAVALAVKQGKADVGVASGYVAELYDVDFIPLTWEEYDFLVPRSRLEKPLVRDFVESLRNRSLFEDFKYRKYYRFPSDMGYEKS
jgi:putative molybdopterin biosynthesis protein